MFEKKNESNTSTTTDVFRPAKGSAKVVIGHGVTITGEIKKADEVQIDGEAADITIDVWGSLEGDIKASGTLTIQEEGIVKGSIDYQNLQIKLGGQISGDIKLSDKVQSIKKDTKNIDEDNVSMQDAMKKDGK